MSKNTEIGDLFEKIADILEILEENPFRVKAYRNAGRNVGEYGEDVSELAARNGLSEIPGVGPDLTSKIKEYLDTGTMKYYEDLKTKVPEGLAELLGIQGLGPKTLARLHKDLGVNNLETLERILQGQEILKLRGMGAKKIEDLKRGIEILKEGVTRTPLGVAIPIADKIIEEISKIPGVQGTVAAGSLRRRKETVGDIDILTMAEDGERVIKFFTQMPMVREVLGAGETKGSIILQSRIQVDLRVVDSSSYGAALQYFSGSQAHNVKIRTIAQKKGLKINEYGIYRGDEKIAGATEEELYRVLDMPLIPPEIREDKGEIECAIAGTLPNLIELRDIKGDLHTHTKWSDGRATIEEMALKAKELGYEYIAITDHSPSSRIANGLSIERVYEKKKELEAVREKLKDIKILMGSEVDIRTDGTLDYPDEILRDLGMVVVSVHSGFKMDGETMTKRIVKALQNPYVHALGHPTGRLIGERDPYEVDIDEVIKTAKEYGKALEVNSYHLRLDLKDIHVKKAIDAGVKILISTDSHFTEQLEIMKMGVDVARRGWAEKKDVINAMPFDELSAWLRNVRNQ